MKPITSDGWILVHQETGKPATIGEKIEDFTLKGGRPPHKPSSTGRVWVEEYAQEYFPIVVKLKWVRQLTDQQIADLYDRDPNMTLAELSSFTGLTCNKLKEILMP